MGNALILSQVMLMWLDKLTQMQTLMTTVHQEGRDISAKELDELFVEDDVASAAGRKAIADARANAVPEAQAQFTGSAQRVQMK